MAKGTHDPRYRAVIEALRSARTQAQLSQVELASRLGKRQQYVSKYEAGERRLDVIEYTDIARALGVDWKELIQGVIGDD